MAITRTQWFFPPESFRGKGVYILKALGEAWEVPRSTVVLEGVLFYNKD